ncbi:MAG: RtcB family protein [Fibrobacter sp.]|nr:RtcB family protein [Fibrobacter sp.]
MLKINGKYTTAKVMTELLEESCLAQIHHFVNHQSFTNPVAIMPDTHAGKGSVIGFTMPLPSTVIPNVIGVDIGCGMLSFNIGKDLKMPLEQVDHKIRQKIPFGMSVHEKAVIHMESEFPWHDVSVLAQKFSCAYGERFGVILNPPLYDMNWFMGKCDSIRGGGVRRFINSIGTLGGGNHFVEIGISEQGDYWLTVHTGSRNFGKCICEYWQGMAAKRFLKESKNDAAAEIARLRSEIKDKKVLYEKIKELKAKKKNPGINLKGCEWLEGNEASGYLFDMIFSQVYAEVNRRCIGEIICGILDLSPFEKIETVHNYIDFRDLIIRKGAVRSYCGEEMIIPFNMRDGILICEGKSNPQWNFSAPHGAGRVMSRGQAKREINLEEFKNQMKGIYSTSVGSGTIDEAPDAYKPARFIEEAIKPTASIIGRIRPVLNMKDSQGGSE